VSRDELSRISIFVVLRVGLLRPEHLLHLSEGLIAWGSQLVRELQAVRSKVHHLLVSLLQRLRHLTARKK
jgi:hypothetical protein